MILHLDLFSKSGFCLFWTILHLLKRGQNYWQRLLLADKEPIVKNWEVALGSYHFLNDVLSEKSNLRDQNMLIYVVMSHNVILA